MEDITPLINHKIYASSHSLTMTIMKLHELQARCRFFFLFWYEGGMEFCIELYRHRYIVYCNSTTGTVTFITQRLYRTFQVLLSSVMSHIVGSSWPRSRSMGRCLFLLRCWATSVLQDHLKFTTVRSDPK